MNINAINFNQNITRNAKTTVFAKNSTMQTAHKNEFYENFPYQNYYSINFTSLGRKETFSDTKILLSKIIDELCEGIESEAYRDDLKTIIIHYYNYIKSQDERIDDKNLLNAIECAFLIVEDEFQKEKYYNTTADDMLQLIMGCYNSIVLEKNPCELLERCKDQKDSMDLISSILAFRTISNFDFEIADEIAMTKKYFKNEEGKPDIANARLFAHLLNAGNCIDTEDLNNIAALVMNENETIDKDKFNFTFNTLNTLNEIKKNEIPAEIIEKFKKSINIMEYMAIEAIQKYSRGEDEKFNANKAQDIFKDWLTYAKNERLRLNREIQLEVMDLTGKMQKISIDDIMDDTSDKKYFDNTIYRLYRLLV